MHRLMEPTSSKPLRAKRGLIVAVAVVLALIVGGLMAGTAAFFGVSESDVILIGVLGGLGSAASVFAFTSGM
jgi:hypothetical protein